MVLDVGLGLETTVGPHPVAEAAGELPLAAVADLGHPAGQPHPRVGAGTGGPVVVVPAAPAGVGGDRRDLGGVEGDLLGGRGRPAGDDHRPGDAVGIAQRPLQGAHPPHRPADHTGEAPDPERVGQQRLHQHLVTDGDLRPAAAPGPAVRGGRGRAGRPLAAAQDVRAHDEVAFGVQRPARTDHRVPPATADVPRAGRTGGVAVTGQRVQDQQGVGRRRVEPPPGLIGHCHAG